MQTMIRLICLICLIPSALALAGDTTNMTLTTSEAALIQERRLPWPQRIVILKAREAANLAAAVAKMTPTQRAAYDARLAEQARVAKLPPGERRATHLLQQKTMLTNDLARVETELKKPEIVAAVGVITKAK